MSKAVAYRGVMHKVELSIAGKLLAHCCRLIGTPLALYAEENVPTDVKVYPDNQEGGMTWDRYYHYAKHKTNRVQSTKRIDDKNGLMEVVGCGFGMWLKIAEERGAIVFTSTGFFWQMGERRFVIPDWLSPGKTVVKQRALDEERFEFSLRVRHPISGRRIQSTWDI